MMRYVICAAAAAILIFGAIGCEKKEAKAPAPAANAAAFASSVFLASAPAEAKDIKDAKPTLKPGDKVALTGRIGGSIKARTVFL